MTPSLYSQSLFHHNYRLIGNVTVFYVNDTTTVIVIVTNYSESADVLQHFSDFNDRMKRSTWLLSKQNTQWVFQRLSKCYRLSSGNWDRRWDRPWDGRQAQPPAAGSSRRRMWCCWYLPKGIWSGNNWRGTLKTPWSWGGSQIWCRRCWLEIWWEGDAIAECVRLDRRHLWVEGIPGYKGKTENWRWSRTEARKTQSMRSASCKRQTSCILHISPRP